MIDTKENRSGSQPLDLRLLPTYGFQFALRNLGPLRREFLKVTGISLIGGLFGFYGTYLLADLISKISTVTYEQISFFYIPVFLTVYLLKELFEYLTRRFGETFPTIAGNYFSVRLFSTILTGEPSILTNLNKEQLFVASTRYLGRATSFLGNWVWDTSRKILQFVLIITILASQSIYICGATLLYLVVFLYFALNLSKKFAPLAKKAAESAQSSASQITQGYFASATITRLGLQQFFLNNLFRALENQTAAIIAAQRFHAKRWLLQLNAFNFLYIGTLFFGIYQVKAGIIPLGFLLLIRYAFERLWEILVFVIEKYVGLVQEKAESEIFRFLISPLAAYSPAKSKKPVVNTYKQLALTQVQISLTDSKREQIFRLLIPELNIALGDRMAIEAPSGSGKTTFLLALMNLIPFDGDIKFDGRSLKEISLAPQLVSYISPSEQLFPLSLADNITLGRPCSPETLAQLINGLGINEFVSDPTVILGDAHANLSMGQSQRIRIARGILTKSPLLLLDEPFSGLDQASREKMKEFIIRWCEGCTIIVASHDSTDRLLASKHFVIRDGTVSPTS